MLVADMLDLRGAPTPLPLPLPRSTSKDFDTDPRPRPLPPPKSTSQDLEVDLAGGQKEHQIRAKRETPPPTGGPYISECTAALGLFSLLRLTRADVCY